MKLQILAVLVLLLAGCTFVRPNDATLIDTTAANARAYNAAVQADATIPAGVKTWIKSDAGQWTNFANWANGRPATTQP